MKNYDSIRGLMSELEAEGFQEEMDILLGDKFGAVNVADSHIACNLPEYIEEGISSSMIANESDVQKANDLFKFPSKQFSKPYFLH